MKKMKNKNNQEGIALIFIIIIIIVIITILAVASIIFINGNKVASNKTESKVVTNKINSESLISYINSKNELNNKLAFLLKNGSEIEYVLTMDFDKKINLSNDYLEDIYNRNCNVLIEEDYKVELKLEDIKIEIDDEDIDENDEIIDQKDNWYLVKWADEYTKICLKIQNPKYSWKTDWVSFNITDSDGNEINKKYFDKLTQMANIYVLSEEENLTFTDFDNNIVNLSDYLFFNDYIASSLTKHGIYLKEPSKIKMDVTNDEILYPIENKLYFIQLCDDKKYNEYSSKDKNIKTFKYNGTDFELFSSESASFTGKYHINVYKKISNEKYLNISILVEDINNTESIIDSITKDLF